MKRFFFICICLCFLLSNVSVAVAQQQLDASAVRNWIGGIQRNYGCAPWVSIEDVRINDKSVVNSAATVIVEIDLKVLKSFDGESVIASNCTGTYWDMDPGKVHTLQTAFGSSFFVGQELGVRKVLEFQKFDSGWRCLMPSLQPLAGAFYQNNRP